MPHTNEAVPLLGDLITFTIKRADVRTANLAIDRLGDRLEAIVREDLAARPLVAEVFADEVAYHAAHVARACLEVGDEENLAALVAMVERVTVALLEAGHGPAAHPLVSHLVHLGLELVRRQDGPGVVAVTTALERTGATLGAGPGAHLLDAAVSGLGAVGAAAARGRFEASPLEQMERRSADPSHAALDGLERLAALGVAHALDEAASAAVRAVSDLARALADAGAVDGVGRAATVLRRTAEAAALAGRGGAIEASLEALAGLAEVGRRLDQAGVVEAALRALALLGVVLEAHPLALLEGGPSAAAACARHLRAAGEGYEYLVARALRAAGEGPFRRRFQGGPAGSGAATP